MYRSFFVVGIGRKLLLACAFSFLWSVSARADESASLFKTKCAACHGPDGAGTAVGIKLETHDLRSADVQKMSDDDLAGIIGKGKNKMPGYEKTLKAAQIKGLVTFTRSFAEKK